jgi:hypothetical protein
MRLRACALVFGTGFALVAISAPHTPPLPPHPQSTWAVAPPAEFGPPEVLLDGSEYGAGPHPHYADFDDDGRIDQLVGIWDRLLVYRNVGTNAKPEYAKPTWFDEAEPSARIPFG